LRCGHPLRQENSTLCSTANGGFADKLPWEPKCDGSPQRPMQPYLHRVPGYNALFGHKYVTQAFHTLGLGSNVLDGNGNLKDINGNTIVDDFPAGTLTPGFPGFSACILSTRWATPPTCWRPASGGVYYIITHTARSQ